MRCTRSIRKGAWTSPRSSGWIGDRVALIGNVNCGLLTTGTDEEVIASVRYALQHGMPGSGYIFATSNCVYTGMPLSTLRSHAGRLASRGELCFARARIGDSGNAQGAPRGALALEEGIGAVHKPVIKEIREREMSKKRTTPK